MERGDIIGKYRLVTRLGQGGMGEVWLADASGHGGFTKQVVLKTLLPEVAHDPLFIDMLAHEARTCARLSHPNLIEVFDFSEHSGVYLLAMEHVIGRPLSQIMKAAAAREQHIPVWFALRVAWECCRGLEAAHDQGVIHCDLSPSNIMVSFTGVTKILDFGVAHNAVRGTRADRLKGKYAYMAPERIKSLSTDRRTDVYALGVVLYLLFTGRLPFAADTDEQLLQKIVTQTPRKPSYFSPIAPEIEAVILRAMQPDPAQRHQTIHELLAELTGCLEGQLGSYGQHDVAQFVCGLFDTPDVPRHVRASMEALRDAATPQPGLPAIGYHAAHEIDSVDVVIEPSLVEITYDAPPVPVAMPKMSTEPVVRARGSEGMRPLARPPVTGVFGDTPPPERSVVHSLFGSRPRGPAQAPALFERGSVVPPIPAADASLTQPATPMGAPLFAPPPPATGSDHGRRAFESPVDYGWLEPSPEPVVAPEPVRTEPAPLPPPPRSSRSAGGGFGSYSSAAGRAVENWPWPSSRKSE